MLRYIVILLLLVGLAPVVPGLVEARLGAADRTDRTEREQEHEDADLGSGLKRHRISVDRRGHYVADAYLNGRGVDMLVDTGATLTALHADYVPSADQNHRCGTDNESLHVSFRSCGCVAHTG